jgi:hypothetical protein
MGPAAVANTAKTTKNGGMSFVRMPPFLTGKTYRSSAAFYELPATGGRSTCSTAAS